MATQSDAVALREFWASDDIQSYEGQWIAFLNGSVIQSAGQLESLLSSYADEIKKGKGPIFAFVLVDGIIQ